MEFPDGFPEHLRAPVDAAIAQAEIDLSAQKKNFGRRFESHWHGILLVWAKTIFFAFARQCCQAGHEGIWDGTRIRIESEKYLTAVAHAAYIRIVPLKHRNSPLEISLDEISRAVKEGDEWREFQSSVKGIAEGRADLVRAQPKAIAETPPPSIPLSEKMDRAAALLHVSHDTMALRIRIGRTTYFAVKRGGGRPTSRMKVEAFVTSVLQKMRTNPN